MAAEDNTVPQAEEGVDEPSLPEHQSDHEPEHESDHESDLESEHGSDQNESDSESDSDLSYGDGTGAGAGAGVEVAATTLEEALASLGVDLDSDSEDSYESEPDEVSVRVEDFIENRSISVKKFIDDLVQENIIEKFYLFYQIIPQMLSKLTREDDFNTVKDLINYIFNSEIDDKVDTSYVYPREYIISHVIYMYLKQNIELFNNDTVLTRHNTDVKYNQLIFDLLSIIGSNEIYLRCFNSCLYSIYTLDVESFDAIYAHFTTGEFEYAPTTQNTSLRYPACQYIINKYGPTSGS